MLQETHLKTTGNMILGDKTYPHQYHSKGSLKARGTAILIHRSVHFKEIAVKKDDKGRFLAVKGLLNGELVTLVSLYAPNTSQILFIADAFQKMSEFGEGIIIAAGDLNYITDLYLDRSYKHGHASILKENTTTKLHDLLEVYHLTDTWRHLNPGAKDYTFFSLRHNIHTRIDFILTSTREREKLMEADIGIKTISDHSWVSCDIHIGTDKKLERQWSLNKTLLLSDLLRPETEEDFRTYLQDNTTEDDLDTMIWDALKATLWGSLISKAAYL